MRLHKQITHFFTPAGMHSSPYYYNNIKLWLTLVAIAASSAVASAQNMRQRQTEATLLNTKIVSLDREQLTQLEKDSILEEMSVFYYDQFRHFYDPNAPYFMFMSRDGELSLGIGGVVRMRGWYEWNGVVPDNGLVPYLIPIPEDPARTRRLSTTPSGTSIFMRLIGKAPKIGDYQLYIEGGFSGYNSRDFKLKKAYATIRDFTVGYASSTFSDPVAQAPNVDAQGTADKIDNTRMLVRYMPTFGDRWTIAISAEYPDKAMMTSDENAESTDIWLPDFAAFVQYAWENNSHVRLAGIIRTMGYRNLITQTNHDITGWGIQASAIGTVLDRLTLMGTINYGHGLGGLTNDLLAGNYDLVADISEPGKVYAPASLGWDIGIQYNFSPSWFASATISQTRYLPGHEAEGDEYKYGIYADVNMFYDITPRIRLGAEYGWGLRRNFNGAHRHADRIGAMVQFSF